MASKELEIIFNEGGVHPIGPYSQCIKAGGFVFLAGQVPCDSQARVVPGTIAEQAHKMFQNTKLMLESAGTGFDKVVKVTIYFMDIDKDFAAVNEVFGQYFVSKPARTSVQVAKLPVGCPLEMDVTAVV